MLAVILWVSLALTDTDGTHASLPVAAEDTTITETMPVKPKWIGRGRAILIGAGIGLGVILGLTLIGWLIGGPDGALLALLLIGVLLVFVGLLALVVVLAMRPRKPRGRGRPGVIVVPPPPPPVVPPPAHRPPPGHRIKPGPAPRTPRGQTTPPPPRGGNRPRP